MVDPGLHPYAPVAIPAQSPDAVDCARAASPGPVGSVAFKGSRRAIGTGTAALIAAQCLLRDQVVRGTSSIGCSAAEDADGIEPERLLRCAVLQSAPDKTERGNNMVRSNEDLPDRDRLAQLRFAVVGGLLACPPAEGELQSALEALAARTWRHPFTGLDIRFGTSTIQRWYYAARRAAEPVSVFRNQVRQDIGRFPSFSPEAAQALRVLYAEHPGWNAYWQACQ
jgi:hypothetical protein